MVVARLSWAAHLCGVSSSRWQKFDIPDSCSLPQGRFFLLYSPDRFDEAFRFVQGLTLVISPLIALMKDQVDGLVARGIKAANLDSTLSMERSTWVKDEVLSGSMKILYVAPERLVALIPIDLLTYSPDFRLNNEVRALAGIQRSKFHGVYIAVVRSNDAPGQNIITCSR